MRQTLTRVGIKFLKKLGKTYRPIVQKHFNSCSKNFAPRTKHGWGLFGYPRERFKYKTISKNNLLVEILKKQY